MWYLIKRGLQMLAILAILSVALFGLLSLMPGNPVDLLITSNPNVKPEDIIRLKRLRGLDKPWYVQYIRWIFGYPDPARPPLIGAIPTDAVFVDDKTLKIDLSKYLVDPNFIPDKLELEAFLQEVWPEWKSSKDATTLTDAIKVLDVPLVLLTLAQANSEMQARMVGKIEQASLKNLEVEGLFGANTQGLILTKPKTQDPHLWFLVKNTYGQEKIGRITTSLNHDAVDLMTEISSRIVEDEEKPLVLDLKSFLVDPKKAPDVSFALVNKSEASLSPDGKFTCQFLKPGQDAFLVQVTPKEGPPQFFAFDVEHGVVGHKTKFNRGFLYFFLGDKQALGFSQTYKRPVYDILFGADTICGDNKIDPAETCDDGNRLGSDGCEENCFKASDTFALKADATISGYIVRSGRIGNTVQLMFPALILSLIIAIPLGVYSAYRQYSIVDYIINFLAFLGISLPVFWFGIMMVYLFAENFQFFPAGGVQAPNIYGSGTVAVILDRLKHAILPTIVLSVFYVGRWLRYMRASMLEVLPKDYIRTARAKGLSERVVILKHAFRNALIPVVTVLSLSIPSLFGGAVLTETVFSWPGIGRLQYEAVMNSDYYVAIIVFLVVSMLVMVGNFLADAIYVLADPRIRKQG